MGAITVAFNELISQPIVRFQIMARCKCLIMIFFEIPVMSLNALTHMHSPMNFHGRPAPVQLASES